MTTAARIDEKLLDDVLERLEELQLLRDEGEQIDWSNLDDLLFGGFNSIGATGNPDFDHGFTVGRIVTVAMMLGIPSDDLLAAARERERQSGRRSSTEARSRAADFAPGPPPPVPIEVPSQPKEGNELAARPPGARGGQDRR